MSSKMVHFLLAKSLTMRNTKIILNARVSLLAVDKTRPRHSREPKKHLPAHISDILRQHMKYIVRQIIVTEVVHQHQVVQAVLQRRHPSYSHRRPR